MTDNVFDMRFQRAIEIKAQQPEQYCDSCGLPLPDNWREHPCVRQLNDEDVGVLCEDCCDWLQAHSPD